MSARDERNAARARTPSQPTLQMPPEWLRPLLEQEAAAGEYLSSDELVCDDDGDEGDAIPIDVDLPAE